MCFEKFLGRFLKRLEWYDISFVKLSVFFFTLFLISAAPAFGDFVRGVPWYAHLFLALLFSVLAMRKAFRKK